MAPSQNRIVVVGAGISGLAAAWAARRAAADAGQRPEILVLEREAVAGGKACTLREDPWLVEQGPTGFLDNEPELRELITAAGLDDELLPASVAAQRRFLVRGGKLREVKPSPVALATSGILGPLGFLRLAAEPFIRGRDAEADGEDESVWDFARRRLGKQAADRMIAPMVLGVFAGDARQLSLAAAFPKLAALEAEHGSLVRGMLAKRKASRASTAPAAGGPAGPAGALTSFRRGMQSLPEALVQRGDFQVRLGCGVDQVLAGEGGEGWRVVVSGGAETIPCDQVVLAGEPWAMAPIIAQNAPRAADLLATISCPPVTVVALGYDRAQAAGVPVGFGALIPRSEGLRMLGCLWDTHLFAGRSAEGSLLVRVMLGGSVDPGAAQLADAETLAIVREELGSLLGISGEPGYSRIVRWPRAIPQYEIGHPRRVAEIASELERRPGLHLAGNAVAGIAFGRAAVRGLRVGTSAGEQAGRS